MVIQLFNRIGKQRLRAHIFGVSVVAAVALWVLQTENDTFMDLWLTPDQQGRLAYDRRQFPEAADMFEGPAWKGAAQYRAGQYNEAADTFGRITSATGFFNRGDALMKAFEYRSAITAYERALLEQPDWVEAEENLILARFTLEYIERARAQSDTGEESGIGADDVVYDNESGRGTETEVSRESVIEAQSAEKWMRSVDTETADFLRSRFLLEASRRGLR